MANLPAPYEPPQYGAAGSAPLEQFSAAKSIKKLFQFHDLPIQLSTAWDVPTAQNAIDQHTVGYFYNSALLSEAMMSDDSYDAVINTRILGLTSRELKFESPAKLKKDERAKQARKDILELWDDICPEETQSALLAWAHNMGFALAQIVWRYEDGMFKPRMQPWHPGNCYYRIDTRTFVANTYEGPTHIKPGEGNWFLFTPYGQYRGWMRGAVRSCWVPFLARQYAIRDWARYNEVHGLPIKKLKYPTSYDADDAAALTLQMSALGNETVVPLPQGAKDEASFDLELLEAKADTYESFQDLIQDCASRFAIRLLGQNLTTDVDAGSLAAANVHDRVRLDYVRGDAKTFGAALRSQLLQPFCQFNYGDDSIAPTPAWNTKPPEDLQVKGRAIAEISVAAQNFANSQAPVDQRELLKQAGIPVLPPGVKPPPPPDPGEHPENPGGGGGGGKNVARLGDSVLTGRHQSHAADGQRYADTLIDAATRASIKSMAPHLKAVLDAVDKATTPADLRRRLKAALKSGAGRRRLAKQLQEAIVLAEMAGRHAVRRESAAE